LTPREAEAPQTALLLPVTAVLYVVLWCSINRKGLNFFQTFEGFIACVLEMYLKPYRHLGLGGWCWEGGVNNSFLISVLKTSNMSQNFALFCEISPLSNENK